jgi:hypothetical protein
VEAVATGPGKAVDLVERRAQSNLYYREILRGHDPSILARIPERNINYVDLMGAESRAREIGDLRASRKLELEVDSLMRRISALSQRQSSSQADTAQPRYPDREADEPSRRGVRVA